MISSPSSKRRLLVPRWRPLATTLASGELSAPREKAHQSGSANLSNDLAARLANWRQAPSAIHAAEVVESAIVYGKEHLAVEPARWLVRENSPATLLLRQQAARLLVRSGLASNVPANLLVAEDATAAYWRERTRTFPRDALAWVELALSQTSCRHNKGALRSVTIALNLAPNNRHVLRSAARFFLHVHDAERAYHLIRRSEATPYDPWLMAAEIALAECIDRSPVFMKAAIGLLKEGSQLPHQVTELAGAVGTTLLTDGNRKLGKKHFRQSLAAPTANALAQAEWASEVFHESILLEGQLRRRRDAKEALALHAHSVGAFQASVAFAREWISEERFSARGYIVGSDAANMADDFQAAEELSRQGLAFDHRSNYLLNSLAFSLASQGHLDEAEKVLRRIPSDHKDKNLLLVAEANRGLVSMRRGNVERGRDQYRKAIQGFRAQQNLRLARTALAFWAREAIFAGLSDGPKFLQEAKTGLVPSVTPGAARVIKEAEARLSLLGQGGGLDKPRR
jgi:tetratricopeptide (TPR) repeat protein